MRIAEILVLKGQKYFENVVGLWKSMISIADAISIPKIFNLLLIMIDGLCKGGISWIKSKPTVC